SLKVTAPDSTVYWGNVGLINNNLSTSGGAANTIDTVENVFLQSPAAGDWTLEVIGTSIVQEAHPSTPAIDAGFGLVASGVVGVPLVISLPGGVPTLIAPGVPS